MATDLSTLTILFIGLSVTLASADVSHLRNNRPASTRLQRLEANDAPYAARGYRPNREFNLPREQPLFPLGNQQPQQNTNNFGFEDQAVPQQAQQPQLTYGAPARLRQAPARLRQEPARLRQASARLQQPQQFYNAPQQQQQQQPQRFYNTPQQPQQLQSVDVDFENQSQPQRPELIYGAPARHLPVSQAPARLQQPIQFYAAPQAERLTNAKPARLTDNREDKEDEEDSNANNSEASADIETDQKKDDSKKSEAPQTVPTVTYYPAGAFGFVQPISAAYVAAPSFYQSSFVAASPYTLQQQALTFAAPAQLQAW